MANWAGAVEFLAAASAASLAWGTILWYCNERSNAFRRGLFYAMSFTRAQPRAVQSLLLGAIYYTFGLLVAALFAAVCRVPVAHLFSWAGFSWPVVVLGIVGSISLSGLLVEVGYRFPARRASEQVAEEIRQIPWIKGIEQLPAAVAPLLAALGGALEELFFRGVVLTTMTDRYHFSAAIAIAIAGFLFCVQQVLQVRTLSQALLMSWSCLSISLIGGLLVTVTGSVVPAILCHASFAVFWVGRSLNTDTPAKGQQTTADMAAMLHR
jgi:membrane protease YdiL (CAAX protease family)